MEKKPVKKQKRKVRKGFIAIVLFFMVALLVVLALTTLFPIKKISVINSSKTRYSDKEIIKASEIHPGENLITFSNEEAEENIKKELPYIGKASISKKLNGTIEINVQKTTEKYCIKQGKKYIITNENYKVLKIEKKKQNDLINIEGATLKNADRGEVASFKSSEKAEAVENILKFANSASVKINHINAKNLSGLYFEIENKYRIKFGSVSGIEEKLAVLFKTINEHKKIDNKAKGEFIISGEDWIFNPDD